VSEVNRDALLGESGCRSSPRAEKSCVNSAFLRKYQSDKVHSCNPQKKLSTGPAVPRACAASTDGGDVGAAVRKPPRLKAGGRIGVLAPAGCVAPGAIQAGIEAIRREGFEVELGAHLYASAGYLAGTPEERACDLEDFFRRDDIDAIFCARGGFGSVQLLPYLSPTLGSHAKIFAGYSDITILLNWLAQFCGMVTFHAPMVAMDLARGLSDRGRAHFWPLLTGTTDRWKSELGEMIRPGKAEAQLVGGCLSLLVTTLGTPYEIDTKEKLLFLEDVGEKPYRIERMLTHLKMAGKLAQPAGVIFGDFTDCNGPGRGVREIIADIFRDALYPVMMGMSAGHGSENLALPFGVKMALDAHAATLEMLEAPVV
jgi:muramoyltetrapeptide carboxypeptidase